MRGSRDILRLSIVAICVLIFAAAGWCGGPPAGPSAALSAAGAPGEGAADQGSVGQSYSGSQQPAGAADQGGVSVGPNYGGSSGADGGNGRSPGFDLKSIGITSGITKGDRLKYDPMSLGDMNFTFLWDYNVTEFFGSGNYSGPAGPFNANDSLSSTYTLTMNALSLDIDTAKLIGGGSWIVGGPRLQFTNFSDLLVVDDTTAPALSKSAGKSFSMFGFGFWGTLDLAHMTGLSYNGEMAVFKPRLNAAVVYGTGSGMNYWEWEAFLQVAKTASSLYTSNSVGIGPLAVEIGYSRYYFNEKIQQISGAGQAEGNVRMVVGIPVIRVNVPIVF
ncbi:MAG: hypothetical protein HY914_03030 [Desulfomonile tiedjei]|nr:hypothetical protein [Desulfomonile tiedjei]